MSLAKKEAEFLSSEEAKTYKAVLEKMERDDAYYTEPSFTIDKANFPDNQMPFVKTHMTYLAKHSQVNPRDYISNLRLRLRK